MAIQIGGTTVIDNSRNVIAGLGASMTVGSGAFITGSSVGLGYTDTTGRDAGVGTATGTLIYNESSAQVELWNGTDWVGGFTSPFSATGGTKDTTSRSEYIVHTFTSPGSFIVASGAKTGEYLVIAGGGSSGNGSGGGGGAGGYLTSTSFPLTPGTHEIQVGAGAATFSTTGTPSFITKTGISSITSVGGGNGGATTQSGGNGGSGGGGGTRNPAGSGSGSQPGGAGQNYPGPTQQGFPGGTGYAGVPLANASGGGGGGAGGAGLSAPGNRCDGGPGLPSSITGTSVTRGGGGGGGTDNAYPNGAGVGGPGGGAPGAVYPDAVGNQPARNATANTGGGAGGGYSSWGQGGSGIVIIAYPTS